MDLVRASPVRCGWRDAASTLTFGKLRDKHARTCRYKEFDFTSFSFSSLDSFWPEAQDFLSRTCHHYYSHVQVFVWEAHSLVFRWLSFAVMRGVAEQLMDDSCRPLGVDVACF